jgi:DNA-binding CsgD family transcriptional regulator
LQQPEAVHRVLQAAARAAQARGMRPLLWRLRALLGRVHRATAHPADAEREFVAARAIVEELAADLPDDPVPELGGASLGDHFRDAVAGFVPGLRPRTARQAAKRAHAGLTARECEIAALVAAGRSNREIGAALFISERTVTTHITNILGKLGYATRAQIAAWAVETGIAGSDAGWSGQ